MLYSLGMAGSVFVYRWASFSLRMGQFPIIVAAHPRTNEVEVTPRGKGEARFRLSRHFRILLFIAGEPQKLDRQKYISLESVKLYPAFRIGRSMNFKTIPVIHRYCGPPAMKRSILRCRDNLNLTCPPPPPPYVIM